MSAQSISLADLPSTSVKELKSWWQDVYGHPAPPRLRREFLELAIGYEIQKETKGGLDRATREALSAAVKNLKQSGGVTPRTLAEVAPGARLVREWGGSRHIVTALESGFEYRGQTYKSLSSIAYAITGVKRSGPLFFGLKKGPS